MAHMKAGKDRRVPERLTSSPEASNTQKLEFSENKIPVPTATLDVSVQYKGEYLNNTTIYLIWPGSDTGGIQLGDNGRRSIVVSKTESDLTMRLVRKPKAPQDDPSKYPVLGGEYHFGPITADSRVMILVADKPGARRRK